MRVTLALAIALAACGIAGLSVHAAQDGVARPQAVLELFTSQGCSSCPTADALFESYAKRTDVLALSFSVDYWDYLGWKDTLGSAKFTQRQRAYAKTRGDGQIYTPQMIINGTAHSVGGKKADIERAVATAAASSAPRVPVTMRIDEHHMQIEAGVADSGKAGADKPAGDATLWLVTVAKKVAVPVSCGENAGKTLTYFNVVREMTPIGMWSGQAMSVRLDHRTIARGDSDAYAVILQEGHGGRILGAALLQSR